MNYFDKALSELFAPKDPDLFIIVDKYVDHVLSNKYWKVSLMKNDKQVILRTFDTRTQKEMGEFMDALIDVLDTTYEQIKLYMHLVEEE